MQNKQYQFVALIISVIILMIVFSSFKSNTNTPKLHTLVSNDMKMIEKDIIIWSKFGFEIKEIVPQSVSISTDAYNKESIKGDILLVMIKK